MNYLYVLAENSGLGFITNQDRHAFSIEGYLSNLWVVKNCPAAEDWIVRVNGTRITKEEAQALVDAEFNKPAPPPPPPAEPPVLP